MVYRKSARNIEEVKMSLTWFGLASVTVKFLRWGPLVVLLIRDLTLSPDPVPLR
jgi:hypothetical protein